MSDRHSPTLDQITALAKRRGFVYPTSEIYGGLANTYDLGPLGAQLLHNIKNLWWQEFVVKRADMVGLDSAILQHPETWVASGHVDSFNDPLVEDKVTHLRYRADHLIEDWLSKNTDKFDQMPVVEDMDLEEMSAFTTKHKVTSPAGNPVTTPKAFSLLFETAIGTVENDKSTVYLRGETAQGIFANFKQVLDSTRVKLPFGIGQMGKSFRNEITTGQFVFRTLEFEAAEIEYFFNPKESDWQELFKNWQGQMWSFIVDKIGINPDHLNWRRHTDKERSHYSKDTYDLDYQFPFGSKELWGIAYRTDYDLKAHMQHSGQSLEYTDPKSGDKFIPHVIEPALGLNRVLLMVLCEGYQEDQEHQRTVLKIKPQLAPFKAAIFPLLKNKKELVSKAESIFESLAQKFAVTFDDRGNIGKRYLYQDEIGTPLCITVDFESLEDDSVTIRDRDTTKQERVKIDQLERILSDMLS